MTRNAPQPKSIPGSSPYAACSPPQGCARRSAGRRSRGRCSTEGDRSASTGTGATATAPPPTVPAGCRDNTAIPSERIPATLAPLPGPKTARSLLQKLSVADRSRGDDFCRNAFGPGTWPDLDGNGCSARQDTLRRQGTQLRLRVIRSHGTGCPEVMSGTWADAYTGTVLPGSNMKGPRIAATVQVDHLVSLFNAWVSGAREWPPERRVRFANDTSVHELHAVSADTNFAKSCRGADSWRPARHTSSRSLAAMCR